MEKRLLYYAGYGAGIFYLLGDFIGGTITPDYNYITNDKNVTMYKYSKTKYQPKNIQIMDNTIYEFGGFKRVYVDEVLNQMALIIITGRLRSAQLVAILQREVQELQAQMKIILLLMF